MDYELKSMSQTPVVLLITKFTSIQIQTDAPFKIREYKFGQVLISS